MCSQSICANCPPVCMHTVFTLATKTLGLKSDEVTFGMLTKVNLCSWIGDVHRADSKCREVMT